MNTNQRPGLLNLSKFSLIEALLSACLRKPPPSNGKCKPQVGLLHSRRKSRHPGMGSVGNLSLLTSLDQEVSSKAMGLVFQGFQHP